MNVISVSYRLTRQELSTLLQGLRLGALPGAPLSPVDDVTARRALDQIAQKELAIVAGDAIYVDKLIHGLLQSAVRAKSGISITDNKRTAVLWHSERLFLLGDFPESGDCALTPLPDAAAAREALADEIFRMARPLWAVNVFDPDRRFSVAADDPIVHKDIAQRALALLNDGDSNA